MMADMFDAPLLGMFTTTTHLGAVAVVFALIFAAVLAGRQWQGNTKQRHLTRGLGYFGLGAWVFTVGWYLWYFDPRVSLPLHVCDLASLLAPLTLLVGRRWMRGLLYFWAFALTTQGFITPTLQTGPDTMVFYLFWLVHGIIVGFAIYDLAVLRFRPNAKDLMTALVITGGYALVMLGLDAITGWNYGYLGPSKPQTPSLVDVLGRWPGRVIWMALIAAGGFVLVYLPWVIARGCGSKAR